MRIDPSEFQIKESEPPTAAPANESPSVIQEGSDVTSVAHESGAVKQYSAENKNIRNEKEAPHRLVRR